MTIHHTQSGSIELLDQWGHGKNPRRDWTRVPAVLTVQDEDGHLEAWRVEGAMRDAAIALADRQRQKRRSGPVAAILTGTTLYFEQLKLDSPGIEEIRDADGDVVDIRYNPERIPYCVAII